MNILRSLLDTEGFPPRWVCGSWTDLHGWVHIVSDVAIAGAYAAIPAVLAYFLAKRRDVPFPPVFILFIAFILACGITHLIDASLFWRPWYRLSAAAKLVTALVSWATVVMLIRVIPHALTMPALERANLRLHHEIEERVRAEARVRTVVEAAPNAMLMVDSGGRIVMVNTQAEALFGYARDELLGESVDLLVPERYRAGHPDLRNAFFQHPESRRLGGNRHLTGRCRDGRELPVEIGISPVHMDDGVYALASVTDVSERLRYESRLQEALAHTEILLREVHHRVKNNLQVVSSLLRLHAGKLKEPQQKAVFENCRDRIQAMALIHERLYGSDHFARVNFGAYVEEMARMILRSNADRESKIQLDVQAEVMQVPLDIAVPLSLIASELVLNTVRHAFTGRQQGRLWIRLQTEGDLAELVVMDDGPGMPADAAPGKGGIGFALIDGLVGQIGGERLLERSEAGGVCVRIRWPAAGKEAPESGGHGRETDTRG